MAYEDYYGSDLEDSSVLDQMYNNYNIDGGLNYNYLDPNADYLTQSEASNLYGEQPENFYAEESPDYMGMLGKLGSGALNFVGNNAADLAKLGLGGLGLYGSIQGNQDAIGLQRDKLAIEKALRERELGLAEDKFRLGEGIDPMASKAMGMQLLINRGRMTADQTNPWLNFMYTGRQQMFGSDPKIGNAFANNPFANYSVGAANAQPTSAGQFFQGLDPSAGINRAAGGSVYSEDCGCGQMAGGGALGLLHGGSSGQADDVQANLSHGEYVFDADTVAALGDGNTQAGAAELDRMRERIRQHKRSAPVSKIPPKSKGALAYLGKK